MEDFKICFGKHSNFHSFTVQPGEISDIGANGESLITNGNLYENSFWAYPDLSSPDGEFVKIHMTEGSDPQIFIKSKEALRRRARKNVNGVSCRAPLEL